MHLLPKYTSLHVYFVEKIKKGTVRRKACFFFHFVATIIRGEIMQIQKRKNGTFFVRYIKYEKKSGGYLYGYLEGKTEEEVEIEVERAKKYLSYNAFYIKRKGYFYENIMAWLAAEKIQTKASTYSNYFYTVKTHILPFFADYKKQEITENEVLEFTNQLLQKQLSPKRTKDILIILKQIFTFARVDCRVIFPRVPKQEILVFTKEEQTLLESYLKEHLNLETLGILLCLYTGLRIGEVCALKWDCIDLIDKKIKIEYTVTRIASPTMKKKKTQVFLDSPKTSSSKREIPLPSFLVTYLKEFEKTKSDTFFLTGTKKVMETRCLFNHYKRILRDLSLERYNFHALRHTFATRCIELGFDAKTVSELLGHANVKITLDRYVHPSLDAKIDLMSRLSSPVFED